MQAGFKIIRAADHPSPMIKVLVNPAGSWKILEKDFKTKAARDRRFKELMKEENIIND